MTINVEVGQRWRATPAYGAWTIKEMQVVNGLGGVVMTLGTLQKKIQIQHLKYHYMLSGSEKEKRAIADWQRHGWPLAKDI